METATQNQTLTVVDKETEQKQLEVAESKRGAWGELGVKIAKIDFQLQARAQQAIARLKTPKTIEEVVEAEGLLKEVKAEANAISIDRKSITGPVDKRLSELMLPEKSLAEPVKQVESAIIAVKKADEEKRRQENLKLEAKQKCREMLIMHKNNHDSIFKNNILERVNKVYVYALENISFAELEEFLKNIAIQRFKAEDFVIGYPKNTFVQYVTEDEYMVLCKECITMAYDSKQYLAIYENDLRAKFSDFEVALNNKAEALRQSEVEKANKAAEIAAQAQHANVAAKLDTIATANVAVTSTTKALKQSYAVDMPETVDSVMKIYTAFSANLSECLSELNVSKWFSLTPSQVTVALAKVKNKNEDFNPTGIIFKTVDKL